MNICVLSGSPKGDYSITYQTILYLEKLYPECTFETLNVGSKIKLYESNFKEAKFRLEDADIILFCYPVYTFIVPYQLHRFIELMKENDIDIKGKYAIQISTSKHFFDVTAHNFIKDNCDDLQLNYLGGLSLDMEDLLSKKGQNSIKKFWELMLFRYQNKIFIPKGIFANHDEVTYEANDIEVEHSSSRRVVIVNSDNDSNLLKMIEDFKKVCAYQTEVINLYDFPFKGGCLGCLNCASKGKCVYTDGFDEFLRNNIQQSDCIIYAFKVKDHSMGSLMKLYDDRQFCNGHRTVTMGKPVGYLVLGNLQNENNLNTIMKARADVGGNFLAGIATNKNEVLSLAQTLKFSLENDIPAYQSFYSVGGTRIFRDLIWLMQGVMKQDHKFFKKHNMYDFPQKKRGLMIKMKFAGALISNEKIRKKINNVMNEGMIAPYKEVLEKLDKKK